MLADCRFLPKNRVASASHVNIFACTTGRCRKTDPIDHQPRDEYTDIAIEIVIRISLLFLVIYFCLFVISPFLTIIVWGASWRLRYIRYNNGWRPVLAAMAAWLPR